MKKHSFRAYCSVCKKGIHAQNFHDTLEEERACKACFLARCNDKNLCYDCFSKNTYIPNDNNVPDRYCTPDITN